MSVKRKLIIGIDVAKDSSEVCILGFDFTIHKRLTVVHDSKESMAHFLSVIHAKEKDFEATATVVLESTDHYHKILERALVKHEIDVVVINPIQSDSIKNLSIRKVKNDRTDAFRIAMLYVFEQNRLKTVSPDDPSFMTLKMLIRSYDDLQQEHTAHLQKLSAYVDQIYLNFDKDCLHLQSITAQDFLTQFPLPIQVLRAREDSVKKRLKKSSRRGDAWVQEKYTVIIQKAKTMASLGNPNPIFATLIRSEIKLLKVLDEQLKTLFNNMLLFLCENAKSECPIMAQQVALLESIPGIGKYSAIVIVAEYGDISQFKNAKALTAFAGLDPSVKESGKFKGTRNKISKRGSRLLRKALNMVAMRAVSRTRKNEYINPFCMSFMPPNASPSLKWSHLLLSLTN